ncbi:NAD(P)H-dependent oxidoreductase subunit E [Paratissierella segnis]|jgi:NADH:ubiquinone oxidoreductase subunit E|uniref:NAD(P)H-dependent oxidoreductase subunit E n=1 Tax=Paratissierella segnis TaxID=2763679 RepID=A0A926EV75_9FIRM|nr:NAD(P)H-dependent oxidoreductase subunit E [Paratissierella segnis]MBC8586914.1 NAD(P)H-dependent oxidoreductase subunit E [Paratissierella segnis]
MKIKVCMGSNCTLLGAMNLLDQIEDLKGILESNDEKYNDEKLEIEPVTCMGYCKKMGTGISPVVMLDGDIIFNATGQIVMEKIMDKKIKD